MGIKVPFFGYVLPTKDVQAREGVLSAADRKRVSDIDVFVSRLTSKPFRAALESFVYPENMLELRDIRVETDSIQRPVLKALLDEPDLGTIVVCYRDDLYARGTGYASVESERNHARMIKTLVDRLVPVISLRQTRDAPGISLETQIKRGLVEEAYFTIADNYADNRDKLESHFKKILAKQPLEPIA